MLSSSRNSVTQCALWGGLLSWWRIQLLTSFRHFLRICINNCLRIVVYYSMLILCWKDRCVDKSSPCSQKTPPTGPSPLISAAKLSDVFVFLFAARSYFHIWVCGRCGESMICWQWSFSHKTCNPNLEVSLGSPQSTRDETPLAFAWANEESTQSTRVSFWVSVSVSIQFSDTFGMFKRLANVLVDKYWSSSMMTATVLVLILVTKVLGIPTDFRQSLNSLCHCLMLKLWYDLRNHTQSLFGADGTPNTALWWEGCGLHFAAANSYCFSLYNNLRGTLQPTECQFWLAAFCCR